MVDPLDGVVMAQFVFHVPCQHLTPLSAYKPGTGIWAIENFLSSN
jgi:hypothetical protein